MNFRNDCNRWYFDQSRCSAPGMKKIQNFRREIFFDKKLWKLWFFSSKSLKNWPRFSNTHFWTVKKCQNFLVQMSKCVVAARKRTIYIDFIQKWRINMTHVTRVMLEKDPGIFLLVRRVNDGNMMLLAFEFGWHLWKFFLSIAICRHPHQCHRHRCLQYRC